MSFSSNIRALIHGDGYDSETYNMNDIQIQNTSIQVNKGKLEYLLFEFDKEIKPGVYEHLYKAIKLVKIKRVPKKDLTLASFLQMQEGVITGYYENQINYIQIFANIIKPERLGLIFAYGVQGVSNTSLDDAKYIADIQMESLERGITGTFRTLEYIDLTPEDAQWIFSKLGSMKDMRVLRGVPEAKKTNGRIQTTTFMSAQSDDVEEQTEEFLMGMDEFEYLFVLTATSVDQDVISRWKEQNLKEATYWASQAQGQNSMNFNLSMPMVYAANIGTSEGWGSNVGENFGDNWGTSEGVSEGVSQSEGTSNSFGTSHSVSEGTSHSTSHGTSSSVGTSQGTSLGESAGQSAGSSYGQNLGYSSNAGVSQNQSFGHNVGLSNSASSNEGVSLGNSQGDSWNQSNSMGTGTSFGQSHTVTDGTSHSSSQSSGGSEGTSHNVSGGLNGGLKFAGINVGASGTDTNGTSSGHSWSSGTSDGTSHSVSNGITTGTSTSQSVSNGTGGSNGLSFGYSSGTGLSQGISSGISSSQGSGFSSSQGNSIGQSASSNIGTNLGVSRGESYGTSTSHGVSDSVSNGISNSVSDGVSTSQGTSQSTGTTQGTSHGTSTGHSYGQSLGNSISGGSSRGTSSSMGLGPSIGFGRSFMWQDRTVSYILDLLNFSAQRLIAASNGAGMWFTDIYIATDSEKAANAATSLSMSSWHGKNVLTSPLQVYKPSRKETEYLFKHLAVFSPSTKREGVPGEFESYKYSTLLLPEEIAAYSHPPRANIGGIQAAVDDPPVLTIPGDRQKGDIFIGYVADAEKYSKHRGYKSTFKYSLRDDELHHAYISGASRSGKTVVARRLVAEAYQNVRRGEKKKRLRFLIMDPKQDWRALAKIVPADHFRFYSLSDPTFHPIKMNLLKIPEGVFTERYADKLREIFIRSYGLGDRGFQILGEAIYSVYREAGCFDENVKYNKKDETGHFPATERSKNITLEDVCLKLQKDIDETKQRDKAEAVQRILDRMRTFQEKESSVYTIFCNRGEEGMGIDDLLGADDVIVLESYGMDTKTSAFIFGLITSGVYQYAVSNGGFVKPDNQYETVLVIEEANQVLIGDDQDNLGGANPFEVILDQSAGYGLFIWTLTQKISDMPDSVLANSAIKIIGRQDREDDIKTSIVQIGKDGLIADRVFKNWLPDQPTGWFIIKSSRNRDFAKNAPCHVLVEYLSVEPPTDDELANILQLGEIQRISKRNNINTTFSTEELNQMGPIVPPHTNNYVVNNQKEETDIKSNNKKDDNESNNDQIYNPKIRFGN